LNPAKEDEMAEQDLPEGTDTVIAGASGGDETGASETTNTRSESSTSTATSSTSAIMDKVRSGGEKLSGQAADRAKDLLSQGIERSAEALANVGKLIGDTAAGIDERLGEEYGDYARRAAGTIEGAANSLAAKDPEELIDDTREFIRRSPAVALAGAAIVGFAVARLIKSGLASGSEDREDRSRS
jgi:hypothetical protein